MTYNQFSTRKRSTAVALVVAVSIISAMLPIMASAQSTAVFDFIALARRTLAVTGFSAKAKAVASVFPTSDERTPRKTIAVVATSYSSTPDQTDDTPCITANGHDLCQTYLAYGSDNTIAANFLPIGTVVRFPDEFGDQIFVVRDRMNARYGHGRVDVWLPTRAEAKEFGVKHIDMEIF